MVYPVPTGDEQLPTDQSQMASQPNRPRLTDNPCRNTPIEKRNSRILNVVTFTFIPFIAFTAYATRSMFVLAGIYVVGLLLMLAIRVNLMAVLHQRVLTRLSAGDVVVEWLPIKSTGKMRNLDAQMKDLGFETIGAFQLVSSDRKIVFISPVPVMTTPDSGTVAIGAGPLSFVSDLADGRMLSTSSSVSLEHPGYVRQYLVKRPVEEVYAEHQNAILTLHRSGIAVVAPVDGPEAIVNKVAAILHDQGRRPKPNKRDYVVISKKDHVYRDPELVDVSMRLMAATPDEKL